MNDQYIIDVQDARAALQDSNFVAKWDCLLQQHRQPTAVYASPSWVAHLNATTDSSVRVWRVRDCTGCVVGVAPVRLGEYVLKFSVSNRVLFSKRLSVAYLLGSTPILPECRDVFRRVISGIYADWPECNAVYADAVPTDSNFWQMLQAVRTSRENCYLHVVDGPRPCHLLELNSSFDTYLKTMSSKARANLRREVRKLDNLAQGRLVLSRFTAEENVEEFLRGAVEVSQCSWQQRVLGNRIDTTQATRNSFEDLSRRGLLRSYLLNMDKKPCAFVIGYQHYDVYCYAEIGFDEGLAEYSPGKVLLFLIIEDLHKSNRPGVLNFGVGDASYKRRFGNSEKSDASFLILRRGVVNGLFTTGHSLLSCSIKVAKKLIGRRVTK